MTASNPNPKPLVLVFAGSDPTGGAGIQADIESIASMGAQATPVITAVTVQDTTRVIHFEPLSAEMVRRQANAVLQDMPISAIKIGMIGSVENLQAIHQIILAHPGIPVVLDPILAAGGGGALATEPLQRSILRLLVPITELVTPNSVEARKLVEAETDLDRCADSLLAHGCNNVLITGTHENTQQVCNRLYRQDGEKRDYRCERLEHEYHGSGCTLASAIAALIAANIPLVDAVERALKYCWNSLNSGTNPGKGQRLPNRLYWRTD